MLASATSASTRSTTCIRSRVVLCSMYFIRGVSQGRRKGDGSLVSLELKEGPTAIN